jgi:hypothetical protein
VLDFCGRARLESGSYGGRVAQLGEHLLCKQGVAGSIPATSTNITFRVIALLASDLPPEVAAVRHCAQFCAHPASTWR